MMVAEGSAASHLGPDRSRGLGDRLGALPLHCIEGLRATFGEDADQVDHDMAVAHRGLDGSGVAHIGLHRVHLADLSARLQVARQLGPPHRNPDPVVALAERADHGSPQETRSAENRD
jgi:hypothetical protein